MELGSPRSWCRQILGLVKAHFFIHREFTDSALSLASVGRTGGSFCWPLSEGHWFHSWGPFLTDLITREGSTSWYHLVGHQVFSIWIWGEHKHSVCQFSRSVVSDSLWPHELQHARPPCPSPTPRVHSNSCPSSQWCHPAISILCYPLLLLPPIPPSIRVFSSESTLHMRWPKYWSFSFSIW